MHSRSTRQLDLRNNRIGPEGGVALAKALLHNTTLTELGAVAGAERMGKEDREEMRRGRREGEKEVSRALKMAPSNCTRETPVAIPSDCGRAYYRNGTKKSDG